VVVLSQDFFGKGWTNYELDGLVTRANSGEQILLPIWHNITKQQLISYSPSLADKVARSTTTHTVEEIAAEIVDVIKSAAPAQTTTHTAA
jgi:phosphoribosylaminoimidazole carboxylase (NCAIR synthetase)